MPIKALIFDDNDLALNLLQSFLSLNDIDVTACSHATCPMYKQKASSCPINKPAFNIIISDNNMPGKMGIEFFEETDAKGCKLSNKCKALISGKLTKDIRDRAEKLGIAAFEKPCSFEILGKWLDEAIKPISPK